LKPVQRWRSMEARNQPLMPLFYVHWLEDALFATVWIALIVFGFLNDRTFAIAGGIIFLVSIVVQARWAALRVQRGEKP